MEEFDIIIVGSGLGGLQCAYILSQEGYKVCVLEKNKQIGGNLQTFVRDRCIFDTGIHYIGGLDKGQNLYQYFKYFGLMDKLKIRKMDEDAFDVVSFEDDDYEYKYAQGFEKFEASLINDFPEEAEAIKTYCQKLQEICLSIPLYNLRPNENVHYEPEALSVNARDYVASLTTNKKLRSVLMGTNPLYAGEAAITPLYVHALVISSYIESAWRCVDGGGQIAKILHHSIREKGGVVKKYKDVTQFIVDDNKKVDYVITKEGEKFKAKHYISNVHPTTTLNMVEGKGLKKSYRNRISRLKNTISVFSLHIVFEENSFPYSNRNYYHYADGDVWEATDYTEENWPKGYAVTFSTHEKTEKYAKGLTVLAYMHYEDLKEWDNTFNTVAEETSRGESYEEFKERKAQAIFARLETKFPDIRKATRSYHTSTPLSYRDYIGTSDGSLYGVAKDYQNPMASFIHTKTGLSNLLLTGQNLNMHGVLGVTISAVITCGELLGTRYLIDKIKQAQ